MAELLFFDQGHTYQLDGETIPSVSELTRFLSREIYGSVTQYTLDNAADRGTRVHKCCEALDKYGSCEASEDISHYVKAYIAFTREHRPAWEKIEWAAHHPQGLYAGTIDRLGTVDGKRTLLDIKTSSAVQKALYGAQLNLYRLMLDSPVDELVILHLRPDASYKLVPLPISDGVASACITLHEALKKKKRKGNHD